MLKDLISEVTPEKAGNGHEFTVERGTTVFVGSDPKSTELWKRLKGKKRAVIVQNHALGARELSRCAVAIGISDDGQFEIQKETGRNGESGGNTVYVWHLAESDFRKERLIGIFGDKGMDEIFGPRRDKVASMSIDIETADHLVRLKCTGSGGAGGLTDTSFMVQIDPPDKVIKIR